MKLKRLEKNKYKKVIIGTLIVISITASYLLGKTFSLYQVNKSFEFVNGKVNYYGHSDIYFAYYNGTTWLDDIPKKNNADNLVYDHAECDNNAEVEWDSANWAPKVKNLTKAKTRCSLYFKVEKDTTVPEITMLKAGSYYYTDDNSVIATARFGRLGGTLSCKSLSYNNKVVSKISDINVLGKHTVECTATGNNGLKTTKQETYNINGLFTANNGLNCTGNCEKKYGYIYLQNGGIQFGPYVAVLPGCYLVSYVGSNINASPSFSASQNLSTGGFDWKGTPTNIAYVYSDAAYYVEISRALSKAEFLLTNNSSSIVTIIRSGATYQRDKC